MIEMNPMSVPRFFGVSPSRDAYFHSVELAAVRENIQDAKEIDVCQLFESKLPS